MPTAAPTTTRMSPQEALETWREYRRTGQRTLRDRIVLTFMPMARHIAYRKARGLPPHCDVEDFVACGLEALVRAIDRYDPDRGASLEQYVWTRIHGAILDELRRDDWAPRSVRRDERAINRAREQLRAVNEREPTETEMAAQLGMTPRELQERLEQIDRAEVGSLNRAVRRNEGSTVEYVDILESRDAELDPVAASERSVARARFREAFSRLSAQEREIAVLLYARGATLRQVGDRLGLSESRICQIHSRLRTRLYEQLADESGLFAQYH